MTNKEKLINLCNIFTEETKIKAIYDYQKSNGGVWVRLATDDNNGLDMYLYCDGYKDAIEQLNNILMGYRIAKNNSIIKKGGFNYV